MNSPRAFTLIELLIVVAIIGILSAVVLASLSGAKSQGNDTALKADLATIETQATLYYGIGNTYCELGNSSCINNPNIVFASGSAGCTTVGSVFNDDSTTIDSPIGTAITAAVKDVGGSSSKVVCQIRSQQFLAAGKLTNGTWWCVDWTGTSTVEASIAASKTSCP